MIKDFSITESFRLTNSITGPIKNTVETSKNEDKITTN